MYERNLYKIKNESDAVYVFKKRFDQCIFSLTKNKKKKTTKTKKKTTFHAHNRKINSFFKTE